MCYFPKMKKIAKNYTDVAGQRFGKLTAVNPTGKDKGQRVLWRCSCDCGKETTVQIYSLFKGSTKSCGCGMVTTTAKKNTTHGACGTKLYFVWDGMRQRCTNPNAARFADYGGRGITVCDEWRRFAPFQAWAIAAGYRDGLSLDRIDGDKGYSPDNCRWATSVEQRLNRRDTHILPDGRYACKVAEANGITYGTFASRIKAGWTLEQATTIPTQTRARRGHRERPFD
jgi:hypothetical protein